MIEILALSIAVPRHRGHSLIQLYVPCTSEWIVRTVATVADTLFRYHEVSPGFLQSDEFDPRLAKADLATKFADAEQVFRRWTVLWRSIIMSSLEGSRVRKRQGSPRSDLLISISDLQALLSLHPRARLPQLEQYARGWAIPGESPNCLLCWTNEALQIHQPPA